METEDTIIPNEDINHILKDYEKKRKKYKPTLSLVNMKELEYYLKGPVN